MSYNKKTWVSNEVITSEALNNIENGIEALETLVNELLSRIEQLEDNTDAGNTES